ncbi:hypothetical protein LAV84_22600 [Rhizobium sp. VS19-DR104.2]|uniref:glycosyltransferase family protein n=1 Tax=unclassified Rhizobium TaxID=2613769 RepID=UPI001CC82786|nr:MULTISPECIES: hypothetical protein [unclassified Rhizobium]MBZ5761972.1 hypothetical protein [Rhizobium sp. VS19-DR96]MBZ5768382.1 hypothetical protein [Rhizobium sp. VS19-DR129.2]MBZ5775652.1 hypothetical protein [Rhizobium sp. VS19-DRK62.2]MBZ5786850.1 hypothetical protein [Rhizobium sp. VS19-DR121]MBZ5804420.1 hypothetical protein [Rhizobium sp. VS19-DR181]
MQLDLSMPKTRIGRFAIVKLWPEIKAAEDECIARLKIAAQALGVECVEVNADGTFLADPTKLVSKENVDFVIHLHFDTPKLYDAFSFVALWNPIKFYHEWGYDRCSRNLTTHDDFLSCSSIAADDHVNRMIRKSGLHLSPRFHLYHSTPDIVHGPSLGDGKLAYAGINWDALRAGQSRHQEVLKLLDKTGLLRIYGPLIFLDVKVWAGYDSYVKEVPFDGVSMVHEIAKAGISLVLSSQAHKDAELMSNRLFESIAAGALIICDENAFAKRFFGDCLLYIDSRNSPSEIVDEITNHLSWARDNAPQALAMIERAQKIFREKFGLIQNLTEIYDGLGARKNELRLRQGLGSEEVSVRLNMLMPEYSEEILLAHIDSVNRQDYKKIAVALVVDTVSARNNRAAIESTLATSPVKIELVEADFFKHGRSDDIRSTRNLGAVINELVALARESDAFMVVAPNERLFSNHIGTLAGALQRDPNVNCASTAAILKNGHTAVNSVHEKLDFGHVDRAAPPGYGRFLVRVSTIPRDIGISLPYLNGRPMAVLIGESIPDQQLAASIIIDTTQDFPKREWDDAVENEVIRSFSPDVLRLLQKITNIVQPHHSASVAATIALSMFRTAWLKAQWNALKKHGFKTRFQAARRRLSL